MDVMMKSKKQPLHALTGLRFIAALAVFIHHVGGNFGLGKINWSLGSWAVSFFFVLSGFILTYVYANRLKRDGLAKFYFTRWARIWPLHVVCLLMFMTLFGWRQYSSGEGLGKLVCNLLLLQSWVPDSRWVFSLNGVAWSISTEMFFYAMFPLLLLGVQKGGQDQFWKKYIGLVVGTAIALFSLNAISSLPTVAGMDFYRVGHVNPFLRLLEFSTGMAVGFLFLRSTSAASSTTPNRMSIGLDTLKELASFGFLMAICLAVHQAGIVHWLKRVDWGGEILSSWFRVSYTVIPFALLIFVFAKSKGVIARLLGSRAMVFLGEISFAFYMCHYIVIMYVKRLVSSQPDVAPVATEPIAIAASCFGISLVVSIVLYKLVEMPCKSALLSLYNKDPRQALAGLWNSYAQTIWSKGTLATLIVAVVSASPLFFQSRDSGANTTVVQQTPELYRHVNFGDQMELIGYTTEQRKNGTILRLHWKKIAPLERRRFVHICDAVDEIIAHGPRNDEILNDVAVGETCIDQVFIRAQFMSKAASIGIGFHAKGMGMAKIDKGPRTMNSRRLQISLSSVSVAEKGDKPNEVRR